ncbi:MAG: cytochrome c3 family protein [Nitrospirae bacterium]|uniref:multiheme c-type cytochrome n=1 Tax=Candidatus Magnetobacterium casense TaxID=1455061 RepID=UPI00058C6519|nr:multiheme c-type cytochrome [Candidatus Magnetobacterium casensis]MBF0336459.1 cytochrome c3 family protein [Nitrospirota bacterium]
MERPFFKYLFATIFLLMLITPSNVSPAGYVGAYACFKCHPKEYNDHITSGHPYKLARAEEARQRNIPIPEGYTWDDISYIIGGAQKKVRYIDLNGYIVTSAKDGSDLKTQYNIETGTWVYYEKGKKKPYDCGPCHTTAYNPEGHQEGREGLIGTWAQPGIHCEACHGPGGEHIKNGSKKNIVVDTSAALCGKCHVRGNKDKIPAKNGFISHHEQFSEFLVSPHRDLACTTCHNSHKRAKVGIIKECASCHKSQAEKYKETPMGQVGITCIDCHMPWAIESAVVRGPFKADVRTHLVTINTDENAKMFYEEDGKLFARGYVTLDFACLYCHKNKDRKWAAKFVKTIH